MTSVSRTLSTASTESEAVRRLRTFPKEVIIEAFLSVGLFLRVDSVVSKCKEIHRDRQFKMLMERDEELSEQRYVLAKAQPEMGDMERYYEWMKKIKKLADEQDAVQKKIDGILAR